MLPLPTAADQLARLPCLPACLPSVMQPAASEDVEGAAGDKQKLRTLAGKLLNRKSSKMTGEGGAGAGRGSTGSLDRLAFGGHQLSWDAERRSQNKSGGLAGECIDEEASVRSDSNAGDDMSGVSLAAAAVASVPVAAGRQWGAGRRPLVPRPSLVGVPTVLLVISLTHLSLSLCERRHRGWGKRGQLGEPRGGGPL